MASSTTSSSGPSRPASTTTRDRLTAAYGLRTKTDGDFRRYGDRSPHVPGPSSRYILPQFEEAHVLCGMKRLDPTPSSSRTGSSSSGAGRRRERGRHHRPAHRARVTRIPDRDILMYINSPGGSFTAMTAIYDTMQYIRPDVQTFVIGQAASSGGGGASSVPERREAGSRPNARVPIHQPALMGATTVRPPTWRSRPRVLRMREWLEETWAKHSGRTVEQVRRHRARQDPLSAAGGQGIRPHRRGPRLPQGILRELTPAAALFARVTTSRLTPPVPGRDGSPSTRLRAAMPCTSRRGHPFPCGAGTAAAGVHSGSRAT